MLIRMNTLLLASALALALAGAAVGVHATDRDKPVLEVGQPFPDLVLPALDDGHPMSIADFHGEKVVLHVFASW